MTKNVGLRLLASVLGARLLRDEDKSMKQRRRSGSWVVLDVLDVLDIQVMDMLGPRSFSCESKLCCSSRHSATKSNDMLTVSTFARTLVFSYSLLPVAHVDIVLRPLCF